MSEQLITAQLNLSPQDTNNHVCPKCALNV